jgi:hypothetical protein
MISSVPDSSAIHFLLYFFHFNGFTHALTTVGVRFKMWLDRLFSGPNAPMTLQNSEPKQRDGRIWTSHNREGRFIRIHRRFQVPQFAVLLVHTVIDRSDSGGESNQTGNAFDRLRFSLVDVLELTSFMGGTQSNMAGMEGRTLCKLLCNRANNYPVALLHDKLRKSCCCCTC